HSVNDCARADSYLMRLPASMPVVEPELADASVTLVGGSSEWLPVVVSAAQQAELKMATSSAVNAMLIRLMSAVLLSDEPDGSWRSRPGVVRRSIARSSRRGRFR